MVFESRERYRRKARRGHRGRHHAEVDSQLRSPLAGRTLPRSLADSAAYGSAGRYSRGPRWSSFGDGLMQSSTGADLERALDVSDRPRDRDRDALDRARPLAGLLNPVTSSAGWLPVNLS
jgi:hypothetical protein